MIGWYDPDPVLGFLLLWTAIDHLLLKEELL